MSEPQSVPKSEKQFPRGTEVICYPRTGKIKAIVVTHTPTGRVRIRYTSPDDARRFGEFHTVGADKLVRAMS